jgi:hypothetical protein
VRNSRYYIKGEMEKLYGQNGEDRWMKTAQNVTINIWNEESKKNLEKRILKLVQALICVNTSLYPL